MKADGEMTTATYENVLKLYNDDGSVPEKRNLVLVIEELKKLAKVEREITPSEVEDLYDAQRGTEGDGDQVILDCPIF